MIREFKTDDLRNIRINDYGDADLLEKLSPVLAMYDTWTLETDGIIKAILFYRRYAEGNYEGFIVASVLMDAFDGANLKEFIYKLIGELKISRIETLSLDCEKLNRWHQFLGFKCEGIKRKFLKGKDYRMWAILAQEV